MDKYIYNEKNGLWYELQAIITSSAWNYPPQKKKGISACGDSGICGISISIKRCSTPTCLQAENYNPTLPM